jgi:excisionase family DNA binding protein
MPSDGMPVPGHRPDEITQGRTVERKTLTVEQAGKALGIGRGLAYELVGTGDIPSIRLGRRIVVPIAAVEAMLRSPDPSPHDAA